MYHTPAELVPLTLTAVAIPWAANVRVPVVPVPARYIVSVVMAIATEVELGPAINVRVVPTG